MVWWVFSALFWCIHVLSFLANTSKNCIAAIPYLKNPSSDPSFHIYFSKEWFDALHLSVRNFLCEIFNGTHILCIAYNILFPFIIVLIES